MKKASMALVMASVTALAQQASAHKEIDVNQDKVSDELFDSLSQTLNQEAPHTLMGEHFADFSDALLIEGEGLEIDVDAYLASRYDSTSGVGSTGVTAGACYSNCHSACHGSRGWR